MFNILIPCAGRGQRFVDSGYNLPKPLTNILGKTLIERVVESLNIDARYIYCILKEHEEKYKISNLLRKITPNNNAYFVIIDKITQGAVNSCLMAKDFINNKNPLLISNSDQIMDFNRPLFLGTCLHYDGAILTFPASDPKWSYVIVDKENTIKAVKEKHVISNLANVGLYGWKYGSDFVNSANELIKRDIRTNNEFYIAETYNILLEQKKIIKSIQCNDFLGCGTPNDLETSIKILEYRKSLNL